MVEMIRRIAAKELERTGGSGGPAACKRRDALGDGPSVGEGEDARVGLCGLGGVRSR
jgi:hypothetical protein